MFRRFQDEKYTYIGDVAIKPWADIHLAHRDEQKTAILHVAKIPRAELQISYFRQFHRLVADRFRNLLVYFKKAPEDGVGAHVRPIDDLLQVGVQLGTSCIDLLVRL